MLKNQKGFTLIEIIAAITIVGILTTIAVVSVTKIIESGKQKHYEAAEKNMILAGQSFVQENRSYLPKKTGGEKKIPLSALVNANYIKPIKDYSKHECNQAESYVLVHKYSQSDYTYTAHLKCRNYETSP